MGNRVDNKAPKFTTKRGNTYYINFRLPDRTFFRRSLGTDSLKAVQVTMSRLSPYIPLVQNGSLSVAQFKMHIDGFREATQRDFDTYLLDWLRLGVDEVKRMPELGRLNKSIFPDAPISASKSVEEAKGQSEALLNRVYSGDDSTARMLLATLHQKKVSFGQNDIEQAYEVAGQIDMHQTMQTKRWVDQAFDVDPFRAQFGRADHAGLAVQHHNAFEIAFLRHHLQFAIDKLPGRAALRGNVIHHLAGRLIKHPAPGKTRGRHGAGGASGHAVRIKAAQG